MIPCDQYKIAFREVVWITALCSCSWSCTVFYEIVLKKCRRAALRSFNTRMSRGCCRTTCETVTGLADSELINIAIVCESARQRKQRRALHYRAVVMEIGNLRIEKRYQVRSLIGAHSQLRKKLACNPLHPTT